MVVPRLGHAVAVRGTLWEGIPFNEGYLLKVPGQHTGRQQSCYAAADHRGMFPCAAFSPGHLSSPQTGLLM
jgi:hypothetical protein